MSRWSWCDMETGEFGAGADETWRGGAVAAVRHAWDEVDQVSWSERGHLHEDVRRQSHLLLQIGIPAVCLLLFVCLFVFFPFPRWIRQEVLTGCIGSNSGSKVMKGINFFYAGLCCTCICCIFILFNSWRRGSVVRTSICSWRTFPDLRLIYGWHVTTLWVKCPLLVNQPGQLSLPSYRGR